MFITYLTGIRFPSASFGRYRSLYLMATAAQPAASWHLQPQEYQCKRLSRVRGVSCNALWLKYRKLVFSLVCSIFNPNKENNYHFL